MFTLIWFRAKTLNVLKKMFQYLPAKYGPQSLAFNKVTKQMKANGGNEYDAAVAFMLAQIEVGSGFSGGSTSWKQFRRKVLTDAAYCSDHAKLQITQDTANRLFNEMVDTEDPNSY